MKTPIAELAGAAVPPPDRGSRRMLNRGLAGFVLVKARELHAAEFRAEDLRTVVLTKYPHASRLEINAALAHLHTTNGGVERVGSHRSGVYRVAGTAPNLDDEQVLDKALGALSDLEAVIHRYRQIMDTVRQLRKALGVIK